jgi:hypothetical protein
MWRNSRGVKCVVDTAIGEFHRIKGRGAKQLSLVSPIPQIPTIAV